MSSRPIEGTCITQQKLVFVKFKLTFRIHKLYAADNCNHVVRRYSLLLISNNQSPESTFGVYNNKIDLPEGNSYFRLRQETNDETFWSDIKSINDSEIKYLIVGDELLIFDESLFVEYFIYDGSGTLTTTGSTNKSIKFYTDKFVIIKCLVENKVFTIKLINH